MSTKRPGRPRRPNPDKAAAIWYDSLGGLEPLEILAHATEARKVFNQYVRDAELLAVQQLRNNGASWQDVGDIFGISKQSAWERFGKELNQLTWNADIDTETDAPEPAMTESAEDQEGQVSDAPLGVDWITPAAVDCDEQAFASGPWVSREAPGAAEEGGPAGPTWAPDAEPQQTALSF